MIMMGNVYLGFIKQGVKNERFDEYLTLLAKLFTF